MRMMARTMMACLAMLGAAGCCHFPQEPTPVPDQTQQKFLFETEYLNHAWGYHQNGIAIENDGRVYRYEMPREKEWKPNDNGIYSASELTAKYGNSRTYIMTIPADSLKAMYTLIAAASGGSYSDTLHVGADAGGTTYSCWLTDGQGSYRRLALRLRGDFRFDNLSPSAVKIADWLDTIWQRAHG
jgi:hypothetical protein